MKTYTAAEVHELIERAAVGHDKLALDFRNSTDKIKAEALRRWAALFVPLPDDHCRNHAACARKRGHEGGCSVAIDLPGTPNG